MGEEKNRYTQSKIDFGYNKALLDIRQWMLETFGGDDGSGNLNKIYKHLEDMQIPMEVGD